MLAGLGLGQMNQQNLELGDGAHLCTPCGSYTMDGGETMLVPIRIVTWKSKTPSFIPYIPLTPTVFCPSLSVTMITLYRTVYFLLLLWNYSPTFYCENFQTQGKVERIAPTFHIEHFSIFAVSSLSICSSLSLPIIPDYYLPLNFNTLEGKRAFVSFSSMSSAYWHDI